ncbi:anthranilate synthase component I family protein [Agriterribacter sp.]|uniref:anthranilate synthase component I family protein n=1 Tax=Agriterribacter sp. TaxID=2821509 RepID=UPI002BD1AA23|nr:anthranilate synthase component I family protein [Agriterribacter sp.]HRP54703.1 anthranilate synthase component I family protein [Agriterribacter sp.]
MKRTFCSFPVHDFLQVKEQMLSWANQFSICCFLDDHQYRLPEHSFECILAANAQSILRAGPHNAFELLQIFIDQHNDWCFGHLGYDLKNGIEALESGNTDLLKFDDLFFFVPEFILILRDTELLVGMKAPGHETIANAVFNAPPIPRGAGLHIEIKSRFSRPDYINTVHKLQQHILRGDCYEINFCQEFYHENAVIDPLQVYRSLSNESPNPFSCYYKLEDKYLLCASPERYLRKTGNKVISQPIKGTMHRNGSNAGADILNKDALRQSAKERSENIMIVDLVRNDLAKVCIEGSVKVDELTGIYAFPQVYQMISTISGEIHNQASLTDLFKATFPMGSMTGAPKKRVMQLIEQYERTRRGLFSGSVGYISPERNIDFNVVIRSILYNASNRYLSFQTGSAITYYSNAEAEYEECILKAAAIKKVLNSDIQHFIG